VPLGYNESNDSIIDAFVYLDAKNNLHVYDAKSQQSNAVPDIEDFGNGFYIESAGQNRFAVYTANFLLGKVWVFEYYGNQKVELIRMEKFLG